MATSPAEISAGVIVKKRKKVYNGEVICQYPNGVRI